MTYSRRRAWAIQKNGIFRVFHLSHQNAKVMQGSYQTSFFGIFLADRKLALAEKNISVFFFKGLGKDSPLPFAKVLTTAGGGGAAENLHKKSKHFEPPQQKW